MDLIKKPIEADDSKSAAAEKSDDGDIIMHEDGPARNGRVTRGKGKQPTVETAPEKEEEEGGEASADVYTEGLETQVKLEAYLVAYEAMLADRKGKLSRD